MNASTFQAGIRFGLGLKPGEAQRIGDDAVGWLMSQLRDPRIPDAVKVRYGGADLTMEALKNLRKNNPNKVEDAAASIKNIYIQETGARFQAQWASLQPFVERMVLFWSNHFTVSVQKPLLAALVNAFEAEAIRPHINGYFRDMVLATARHPAMLLYLDNAQSIGPDSRAGRRRDKGLNENYARELMELHTLGVDGGYTQDDVIALARILTGWSLDRNRGEVKIAYGFQPNFHEPGDKTLLGQRFRESGEDEGLAAIDMLARHPSTARHIATKLARHFIADEPPAAAIDAIAYAFQQSQGHLPTVMQAVLQRQEAWEPFTKVKTPYEYALSALRLIDVEPDAQQAIAWLGTLDFRPFNAPSPAGFPDTAEAWTSPSAIMKRIEWSHILARRVRGGLDPLQVAGSGLGFLHDTTRDALERAASGADGLALLLVSPEFMRR